MWPVVKIRRPDITGWQLCLCSGAVLEQALHVGPRHRDHPDEACVRALVIEVRGLLRFGV